MNKIVALSLVACGLAGAATPDLTVIAKLLKVVPGPIAKSMPPIYSHTLHFEVEFSLGGPLERGTKLQARHSVRQLKTPVFPVGKSCVVGLSGPRGDWRVDSLEEATEEVRTKTLARLALPRGWSLNEDGKPLSPWSADAGPWPLASPGTPVCVRSKRPALLCGRDIKLSTEKVPPEKEIKWTNPDGDGLYKITVTNTSATDERLVEALLRDPEGKILWEDSLIIICQEESYVVPGSKGAGRDALPVKLKPGESVSGVVNALALQGPEWPRGGYRIEFQFCLGELGETQSFYYMSRHHDALRKQAQGR